MKIQCEQCVGTGLGPVQVDDPEYTIIAFVTCMICGGAGDVTDFSPLERAGIHSFYPPLFREFHA